MSERGKRDHAQMTAVSDDEQEASVHHVFCKDGGSRI